MSAAAATLPAPFAAWFAKRGWAPHRHQLEMLAASRRGASALLVAPTGGGKTLAGFLPSLVDLAERPRKGLHTLYVSPLKALSVDVHRNLLAPIAEIGLGVEAETRTGDTNPNKRMRQRRHPPQLLLTTPESLALLLSYPEAPMMFGGLRAVVIDEIHALVGSKRGDLLALGLARLRRLAPEARRVGLSATVADPPRLGEWLGPPVEIVQGQPGPEPEISILASEARMPWSGHMALYALGEVMTAIANAKTAIVFVNTRAQAELVFGELWRLNADNLPIALHHGSLAPEQRRKVEAAMAAGALRAVVATSSLDLGIDWGAVDLVIQVGAPKGATRLLQRIGRSNHQFDKPSRAILVPANRFEVLECRAAIDAIAARELDQDPPRQGGLDVLCQHILGMACSAPFAADDLFAEVRQALPYRDLARADFDDALAFVATGGYALKAYDRFRRLKPVDGAWTTASKLAIRQYRMNVGTIVEEPMIPVRLKRGRRLGQVEEYFIQFLEIGDSFVFGGQVLRYEGLRDGAAEVTRTTAAEPKVPVFAGGRLPLTTELAARVRGMIEDERAWRALGPEVREWLAIQRRRSVMPRRDGLLIETFPRGRKQFLVAYCFEGRNAHQTLGMLLTRRMERMGLRPLGFVATDYVIAVWSLKPARDMAALFDQDLLGDDLEAWMAESSMLMRIFRNCAVIAGLIERRHPGEEKNARQVNFNADLIYDVLRKHEPDHILLRATRRDAAGGLTDIRRLSDMLARIKGKIRHENLSRVSPLAVPVLLEIGKESVYGSAIDALLEEEASLIAEATDESTLF